MLPYPAWLKQHGLEGSLHPEDDAWLRSLYGQAFQRSRRREGGGNWMQAFLRRKKVQLIEEARRRRLPAPGFQGLSLSGVYEAVVRLREQRLLPRHFIGASDAHVHVKHAIHLHQEW